MVRGLLLAASGSTPAMGGLPCQNMAACTKPTCDGSQKPQMPIEAREENFKSRARGSYYKSNNKCEQCDQFFFSRDALAKHIASIHTVKVLEVGKGSKIVLPSKQLEKLSVAKKATEEETLSSKTAKEISLAKSARKGGLAVLYMRSEQAEKENEARRENLKIVKSSDRPHCRFCKSNTFLDLECPERKKKAPAPDLFDAEAFLEAEFQKFMGDRVSDDVKVFSSLQILRVLQETESEHMPRCPECHDDFFWPTPSHSCVFTAHGRVVVGGQLVGTLPCLDKTIPPPVDCTVCPPWVKCGKCLATFSVEASLKEHKETNHPVKNNTKPLTHLVQPRVKQRKVPTNWQVLPSKPLKRSAETILFNLPKSTRIELNGERLDSRKIFAEKKIEAPVGLTPARNPKLVQRKCDDCGEKFDSGSAFGDHLLDPLSDMFVCMECASEGKQEIGDFPNQCQLTKHKKSDHKKQPNSNFDCKYCGLSYKSKYLLNKHTQKASSCNQMSFGAVKKPLNSAVSIRWVAPMEVDDGKEVTESTILAAFKKVERRQVEADSSMPCLYCAKIFNNTSKLIMHMKEKHNVEYENDSYLIPCIYCDEEFKEKGKLKEHVEKNHEGNVTPVTVEVNQNDFKMLFPQEQLKVKKEIFPDYREFEEKAELDEMVEGEPDERFEMTRQDFEVERMMQENTDVKMEPVWIFQ